MQPETVVIGRNWTDRTRRRTIECPCTRSAIGTSIIATSPAVSLDAPRIEGVAGRQSFRMAVSVPRSSASFELDIEGAVVAWTGSLLGTSAWIVTSEGGVHRLQPPQENQVARETLASGDSVAVLSGGLTFGMEGLEETLSMSLCDEPSPSSGCSWLLDAADDQGLPGIHFAGLWLPDRFAR